MKSRSREICVYNCVILLEFDRRLGSTAVGGGNLWCKIYCTGLLLPLLTYILNSSPPSAGYMRRWTGSVLVQIMDCRLVGAKPLSEPMLEYCQLGPCEQTSVKFELKYKFFHPRKWIWKCRLRHDCTIPTQSGPITCRLPGQSGPGVCLNQRRTNHVYIWRVANCCEHVRHPRIWWFLSVILIKLWVKILTANFEMFTWVHIQNYLTFAQISSTPEL